MLISWNENDNFIFDSWPRSLHCLKKNNIQCIKDSIKLHPGLTQYRRDKYLALAECVQTNYDKISKQKKLLEEQRRI